MHLVHSVAKRRPEQPALLYAEQRMTYRELADDIERSACWLEQRGVRAEHTIGLLGRNSLAYVTLLLGAARLGARVALLSPELQGAALERALEQASCALLLLDAELSPRSGCELTLPTLRFRGAELWRELSRCASPSAPLPGGGEEDFVYVYTSGTTGLSKPCRVTHRRAVLAAIAFGELVHELTPADVLYCALPLHHSTALLLGLGACLASGATLALRERFSASSCLADVRRFDASVLLYVGDLGRALLGQPASAADREHRLRLAVGNGMSADVWRGLQARFGIPRVAEFYAASEFPGAIVNLTGRVGSVGRVPLGRWRGYRLVRVDAASGALLRDARGRAIECRDEEPGELVLRLKPRPERPTGDYMGYLNQPHGEERIARDLFELGDVYCRSGDLLRRDASGHYYFIDRLGDTFRFKGENVSTREVEGAFADLDGVQGALAVGVRVPGWDGKLGLLVLHASAAPSMDVLAERAERLAAHARPCFVRLTALLERTESLKVKKARFAEEGVDPVRVVEPLFYRNGTRYLPLDAAAYAAITAGALRF